MTSTMQSILESNKAKHEQEPPAGTAAGTFDMPGKTVAKPLPREYGGRRDGLEPTRYGDWEKNGRCIDF